MYWHNVHVQPLKLALSVSELTVCQPARFQYINMHKAKLLNVANRNNRAAMWWQQRVNRSNSNGRRLRTPCRRRWRSASCWRPGGRPDRRWRLWLAGRSWSSGLSRHCKVRWLQPATQCRLTCVLRAGFMASYGNVEFPLMLTPYVFVHKLNTNKWHPKKKNTENIYFVYYPAVIRAAS